MKRVQSLGFVAKVLALVGCVLAVVSASCEQTCLSCPDDYDPTYEDAGAAVRLWSCQGVAGGDFTCSCTVADASTGTPCGSASCCVETGTDRCDCGALGADACAAFVAMDSSRRRVTSCPP